MANTNSNARRNQDGSTCTHALTGIRTNHGIRERVCSECGHVATVDLAPASTRDDLLAQAAILTDNMERTHSGASSLLETLAPLQPASALAILAAILCQLEHEPDGLSIRAMLLTAALDFAIAQ